MLKIRGTEAAGDHRADDAGRPQTAQPHGRGRRQRRPGADRAFSPRYFNYRKTSIYAGSNEIQRNIIAKMTLGL